MHDFHINPIEFDYEGFLKFLIFKVFTEYMHMTNKQILQIENSRCIKDFGPILDINYPYFDLKLVAFKFED